MKRILFFLCLLIVADTTWAQLANWTVLPSGTKFPTNLVGQINGMTRICQMKFHATDTNKFYAVTSQGGLFMTADQGLNWTVAPGTESYTGYNASVCVDYTNDQTILLGTGDPNYYYNGNGVYKSANGGATFTATTLTNCLVVEILQSPVNAQEFVAATNKGIYKTTNAGSTWTAVTATNIPFCDMKKNAAANSLTLFACTNENAARFYRSTDFGSTWTQITTGIAIPPVDGYTGARIAVTPADTNVVYFQEIAGAGIVHKSNDDGQSFTVKKAAGSPYLTYYNDASTSSGQGNYNGAFTADMTNPARVWLQSHNTWLSTDSGATWTMQTFWPYVLHTDMHQITQAPFNSNKLYSCNDGGVWLSTDGGNNWTTRTNGIYAFEIGNNCGISSFTRKNFVSIGTQDNARLYGDSTGWYTISGGDDYAKRQFDYNGNIYYDGTQRQLNHTGSSASYALPFTNWTAFAFNRTDVNLGFVVNNDSLYRTANLSAGTPSWTLIGTFGGVAAKAVHSCIADKNRLYVLLSNGTMQVCTNALAGSPSFTAVATSGSATSTASIAAMANNADIVYVAENSGVYRSGDGGNTWTSVKYNLPTVNHRRLLAEEYGGTQELVFVGTNNAVYYKKAGQPTWTNYSTNLPARRPPTEFSIYDDSTNQARIRYATYGRAMWETPFTNLRALNAAFVASQTNIACTGGPSVSFTDQSTGNITSWSWLFPGGTPSSSSLQNPVVNYTTAGTYDVTLVISDGATSDTLTKTAYITSPGFIAAGGTYDVGVGKTFTTLTSAVNYWNNNCLTGNVVFNLTDASYPSETFPVTINKNTPGSSLTIRPAGTASISGSSATALIVVNGAANITIDGTSGTASNSVCPASAASRNLTLTNTNTATTSAVIWLQTGSSNDTIRNCNITGNSNTTTLFGIGSGGSTIATSSLGNSNNYNAFVNNNIQKVQYGIYSAGASAAAKNNGTFISQNIMNAAGAASLHYGGIWVKFENRDLITGNKIGNIYSTTTTTDLFGILAGTPPDNTYSNFTGGEVTGTTISNNVIDSLVFSGSWSDVFGIFTGTSATAGAEANTISSNLISRLVTTSAQVRYYPAGIVTGGGTAAAKVYFNTIYLSGINSNNTQSFGILIGGSNPSVELKNNIIVNQLGSTNQRYAIGLTYAAPFSNLVSNNNIFYTPGSNLAISGPINTSGVGTNITNLAGWQTATGGDVASYSVLPEFVTTSNPRLNPSGSNNTAYVSGKGTSIAGMSADIDCNARYAATPTIGAQELQSVTGLPLVWGAVTADAGTDCAVTVRLETFNEKNILYYDLQRSTDGSNWNMLTSLKATGKSSKNYYMYTDRNIVSGMIYYRFRSAEAGGTYQYSKVVAVKANCPTEEDIKVFPNPVRTLLTVQAGVSMAGMQLVLLNEQGQKVYQAGAGSGRQATIDMSGMPRGTYLLQVQQGRSVICSRKVVRY